MAVFPERHARTKAYTGRFVCEVSRKGKKAKRVFHTELEASKWQAATIAAWERGEEPTAKVVKVTVTLTPHTFDDCYRKAERRMWVGNVFKPSSLKMLEFAGDLWGRQVGINDIGIEQMHLLVEALEDKGRCDATINHYIKAVSMFLRFCVENDYRTVAVKPYKLRKLDDGRIRWLEPNEEAAALSFQHNEKPWFGKLVKAAIRTGMRRGELLSLTPEQVEDNWVRLWKTKNGTARSVPIDAETAGLLRDLLAIGMPSIWELRWAWTLFRRELGLAKDEDFVFHACRHTCATRLVRAGVHLRTIQKWLGHKSITTTERYAHVMDEVLEEALTKRALSEGKV